MPDDELLLKEGGCHKQDDGMECKCVLVVSVDEKTDEAWDGLRLTSLRGRAFPKGKKRWAGGIRALSTSKSRND